MDLTNPLDQEELERANNLIRIEVVFAYLFAGVLAMVSVLLLTGVLVEDTLSARSTALFGNVASLIFAGMILSRTKTRVMAVLLFLGMLIASAVLLSLLPRLGLACLSLTIGAAAGVVGAFKYQKIMGEAQAAGYVPEGQALDSAGQSPPVMPGPAGQVSPAAYQQPFISKPPSKKTREELNPYQQPSYVGEPPSDPGLDADRGFNLGPDLGADAGFNLGPDLGTDTGAGPSPVVAHERPASYPQRPASYPQQPGSLQQLGNPYRKGLHVPSIVLGVFAITTSWFVGLPSIPTGILGVILALRKKARATYNTTPGLVLSLIGLLLGVAVFVLIMFFTELE
ncbi:MAG: hypothetical protein FWG23_07740 [Eggerthellaceae bacterium]|jgi:hypothetical protein|nr:hypothetical protein [Eggerthellaceae bacterium]MDR2716029.1 hypothetical protein [Coriobacteriaceae bacterium]